MTKEECKKNIDLIEAHTNVLIGYTSGVSVSNETHRRYIFFKKDRDGGFFIVTLKKKKKKREGNNALPCSFVFYNQSGFMPIV